MCKSNVFTPTSRSVQKKYLLLCTICILMVLMVLNTKDQPKTIQISTILRRFDDNYTQEIRNWVAQRQQTPNLTILGRMLFLETPPPRKQHRKNANFQILVWKYGRKIEDRHVKQFTGAKMDPFRKCSVRNCVITYNDSDISSADIVIFHMHRMNGVKDLPTIPRNPNQIWAFLTDESPYNTFLHRKNKLKDFNGVFNWSMTYRMDSDIPVPYGRTTLKKQPDRLLNMTLNKRRDVLVATMGSNCGGTNKRWDYVKQLQKHINVDVYGHCGRLNKACPGHFRSDCNAIDRYMFYLAFENSNCDEYVTEKLWWNAFEKNSIPIVMGATKQSYEKLLPLKSYLNIDDFAHPAALAHYIRHLNQTGDYENFYQWKQYFQVHNEHGYFQSSSFHYCRICEALNYNRLQRKTYDDLDSFWSVTKNCHPAWNS